MQKRVKFMQKGQLLGTGLVCLFTTATFLLFGPINLYLNNNNEFPFYLNDILLNLFAVWAVSFLVLSTICVLIRNEKARTVVLAIVLGIGIGFYVQGNFMSSGYGELNGQSIDWDSMIGRGVLNTVVWILCIVLPVAAVLLMKKVKSDWLHYAAAALIAVQLLATVMAAVLAPAKQDVDFTVSSRGAFTLSKENNVVVFLLDNFTSELFEEIITEDESYFNDFTGFTYFPDTVGVSGSTRGSLPFIVTGMWNENQYPFSEYIDKAYENSQLFQSLDELSYDTRAYVSKWCVSAEHADRLDNVIGSTAEADTSETMSLMYKFTSFVYMPHFLKENFWMYSGDFATASSEEVEGETYSLRPDSAFYASLRNNGLTLDETYAGAYRFYYLDGAHSPYTMDENGNAVEAGSVTQKQQALGSLKMVKDYLTMLRENGIYENTMVIVMADHGNVTDRKQVVNPLLCIKPMDSEEKPMQISAAQITYDDLHPTMLEAITGDESMVSVFDIPEGETRERRFLWYIWNDSWESAYLPDLDELNVVGNARDITSRKWTGVSYTGKGEKVNDYAYKLGKELKYNEKSFDNEYYFYGLSKPEPGFTWTDGEWANWNFTPKDYSGGDISFQIKYSAVKNGSQRVTMYVNGFEQTVTAIEGGTIEFVIPEEYISDGILSVFLQFPDRASSENDVREVSLAINQVVFDYAD